MFLGCLKKITKPAMSLFQKGRNYAAEEDGVFMYEHDPLSQIVELLLGIHLFLNG